MSECKTCRTDMSRAVFLVLASCLLVATATYAATQELPRAASPEAEGIDPAALELLLQDAKASQSSAVVILKNGKLVGEWSFAKHGSRIEAMSVTKSVVGIAVAKLLADGKIPSLDVPVHHYFPEWNQGRKRDVTLRHLLNHTSGLDAGPSPLEIYQRPDFVKLALASEMSAAPGTQLQYNNKAVNLLAGIIEKASGKRMDRYIAEALFRPLGITDSGWTLDRAGNPHVMAGVQLRPRDLAKLGQLLVDGGMWQLRRLLPQEWVKRLISPGEGAAAGTGLLWWPLRAWQRFFVDDSLLAAWKQAGVPQKLIDAAANQKGKVFSDSRSYLDALGASEEELDALWSRKLEMATVEKGPVVGAQANGYLGQFVVVIPEHRLVAVRMLEASNEQGEPDPSTGFDNFIPRTLALVKLGQPPPRGAGQAQGAP
ncbi:serine hydrolase domain-containing protein [Myxococcus fulvus]|uniref:serine hydrolase domain-containing protein n=1 Tax=Myxococcus fulvus TaxID=33 RepID=UPI003B9C0B0F